MRYRIRFTALTAVVAVATTSACAKSGEQRAAPANAASDTASPSGQPAPAAGGQEMGDMKGMDGMKGMAGMRGGDSAGSSGMMGGAMSGMSGDMQTHMRSMMGASAGQLKAMLPMHRQMVANMLAQMNGEMRQMNMASDPAWTATADSLRQDLVRMPELGGAEVKAMMPGHEGRVTRLAAMHRAMMGKMQ